MDIMNLNIDAMEQRETVAEPHGDWGWPLPAHYFWEITIIPSMLFENYKHAIPSFVAGFAVCAGTSLLI